MAYRQTNALFSGYGFSYPSPFIPGYAHQQGQYPGSPDLLAQLPEDGFVNPNFRPMRGTASAAYRSHIQRRSVGTPLPASVPRLPAREQPLILSPSTPRDTPLDKFLKTSSQDQSETSIIQASGNMTAVDKLVAPSAMPIGSVVHLQQSQKWGVVKVANVGISFEAYQNMTYNSGRFHTRSQSKKSSSSLADRPVLLAPAPSTLSWSARRPRLWTAMPNSRRSRMLKKR